MIILGVDPGLNTTGYGILEDKGLKLLECGIWSLENLKFTDKLRELSFRVREVFLRYSPKRMVIEEPFHARNPRLTLEMGKLVGALTLTGVEEGVEVEVYSTLQVKEAVTGYGRADKNQVREMVKRILKLEDIPSSLDASDAVGVAICSILHHQWREKIDRVLEREIDT